jgi:hypothetical protein
MYKLAAIMVVSAFASIAVGQNRVAMSSHVQPPAHVAPPAQNGHGWTIRTGRNGFERNGSRRPFRGAGFRGAGFWGGGYYGWPYFYDDYAGSYEPPPPQPEASHVAIAPPEPAKSEPVPDPVLLELRGDQWVKVQNFSAVPVGEPVPAPVAHAAQKPSAPAVLVFRDGHSEEVSSYSIIGQALYTKADYWTAGAWTRTIQIADLDIPATLKENQQRGVKFDLPSGPNEVVIRP